MLSNPIGEMLIHEWSSTHWEESASSSLETASFNDVPEPLRPLFIKVVQDAKELSTMLHVKNDVWSVVMTPLYDQQMKTVRGAVAVMRDVTEEHRLNKFRRDFVANVSHELRTPISMLQGYSEALMDGIVTNEEERQELIQIINDESQRMGRLVEDLLDLTKMESGHQELACEEVDLVLLADRIVRKFSNLAADRGIQLRVEHQEDRLIAQCADEDRLEQVFTNLIDNALRHTSSGGMVVVSTEKSLEQGQEAALVKVTDNGEGIPSEDLPFIFDRFYKADKARTRGKASGTGLGLSIVSNIVEAHRGNVDVESKLGKGTTFSFTIPLQR